MEPITDASEWYPLKKIKNNRNCWNVYCFSCLLFILIKNAIKNVVNIVISLCIVSLENSENQNLEIAANTSEVYQSASISEIKRRVYHINRIFIFILYQDNLRWFPFMPLWGLYEHFINHLSAKLTVAKHTQTIRRQFADELFECVWPSCGIGA